MVRARKAAASKRPVAPTCRNKETGQRQSSPAQGEITRFFVNKEEPLQIESLPSDCNGTSLTIVPKTEEISQDTANEGHFTSLDDPCNSPVSPHHKILLGDKQPPRKLNPNQSHNRQITEFFAVRRSARKPKTTLLEERNRDIEQAVLSGREDGLEIRNFPEKGRGVVAARNFSRGEFVVEYAGELISMADARLREARYAADQNTGCYMYYFRHRSSQYCVDATAETKRLGRLVNHSRQGNLQTRTMMIKGRPHLVLVARCDITAGEEVLYDYGDRSRESLRHHPWLAS